MGSRLDFHKLLSSIKGVKAVYFQPPNNLQMVYPCIVYERSSGRTRYGQNLPYRFTKRYTVTAIARDPDDPIHDQLAMLPMSSYDRHFVVDGLHHDIFNIYF